MAGTKSYLNYFLNGLNLINRSWEILLASIVLYLPFLINNVFLSSQGSFLISILTIAVTFITVGFSLSVPIFLSKKQQNKKLNFKEIASATLNNTKQNVWSITKIFLIVMGFVILIMIAVAILLKPSPELFAQLFQSQTLNPLMIIFSLSSSILVFTTFFYAFEGKKLIKAMKESIKTSIKYPQYFLIITIAYILYYLLGTLLPYNQIWAEIIRSIFYSYAGLVIIASALFFYQKEIQAK